MNIFTLLAAATAPDNIFSILLPIAAAILSAAGILWRHITTVHSHTREKLDKTELEQKESTHKLIGLSEKVGKLEGRQEGVEQLANSVLREIRTLESKNK